MIVGFSTINHTASFCRLVPVGDRWAASSWMARDSADVDGDGVVRDVQLTLFLPSKEKAMKFKEAFKTAKGLELAASAG